jgi:hypothetical protein
VSVFGDQLDRADNAHERLAKSLLSANVSLRSSARKAIGSAYPDRESAVKKFMVLYMASAADFEKMMKNSTAEQQKKGMEAWMRWMNANKASIVEGGGPLGKTKRVDASGASDTKNGVGGYSIVQAESHDGAAKIFGKDHPHLQMPGAWIEIVEIMPMPGM